MIDQSLAAFITGLASITAPITAPITVNIADPILFPVAFPIAFPRKPPDPAPIAAIGIAPIIYTAILGLFAVI